ncbi:hypothetical protein HID58_089243 [Brassica napus]|uniref:Uncharacterized protein n=1 Tax=Brassica napus TaxID=3708 RepID=A0ABQ7Y061_BRANA|nr:hypothetical protein HID58_089243 [Brassica napus]
MTQMISGFHSNTHIPIVFGSQLRYEITGDTLHKIYYKKKTLDIVKASHSYETGGTPVNEFWTGEIQRERRLRCKLKTRNHVLLTTCSRWTKEASYADYYERPLTNGVLGIQRGTEPGVMIYMLPLGKGVSKTVTHNGWGKPYDSFWCCYGTGIDVSQNWETLYIFKKIWSLQLFIVKPVVSWDPYMRVTFTFSSFKGGMGKDSTLNLRIPVWTNSEGAKVPLDGQSLKVPASDNFLSMKQNWKSGDQVTMELALSIRTEAIKDGRPEYSSLKAILYGPSLLAGHTSKNWSITTQAKDGTQEALEATFRLVTADSKGRVSGPEERIGSKVMIEPFDFPNMLMQATDSFLAVQASSSLDQEASRFRLVAGVDGKLGSVSLRLESKKVVLCTAIKP